MDAHPVSIDFHAKKVLALPCIGLLAGIHLGLGRSHDRHRSVHAVFYTMV